MRGGYGIYHPFFIIMNILVALLVTFFLLAVYEFFMKGEDDDHINFG